MEQPEIIVTVIMLMHIIVECMVIQYTLPYGTQWSSLAHRCQKQF